MKATATLRRPHSAPAACRPRRAPRARALAPQAFTAWALKRTGPACPPDDMVLDLTRACGFWGGF